MKRSPTPAPIFAFLAFLEMTAALLAAASSARAAPAVNPSSTPAVQLPAYEVIEPRNKKPELPNPLFDHAFADLRSGPMIEAILWRYRYLKDHPKEEAVIVTTHNSDRVISATTVYTDEGNVYGSSNALGERLSMRGMVAADLHSTAGLARAQKYLAGIRRSLGDATHAVNGVSSDESDDALGVRLVTPEMAPALEAVLTGGSALDVRGPALGSGAQSAMDPGDYRNQNNAYLAAARSAEASGSDPSPPLGALLVNAEESGDYRILGQSAGPPMPIDVAGLRLAQVSEAAISLLITQSIEANLTTRRTLVQSFTAPSTELMTLTYRALHDPTRAGIVPVALSPFGGKNSALPIPAFAKSAGLSASQLTCLVFDWEGTQYYYQPDIGTWAKPLPLNTLTGQPFLCLKNGALMECAYFCSTYAKQHPDRKAAVIPGEPAAAAYQGDDDKLGVFIPTVGRATLGKEYLEALGDSDYLGQIRDKLVALAKQPGAHVSAIAEGMPGDDGGMQMRRAYLAFKAAGIPCRLDESGAPSFRFTWDEIDYIYGPDQRVRPAPDQ